MTKTEFNPSDTVTRDCNGEKYTGSGHVDITPSSSSASDITRSGSLEESTQEGSIVKVKDGLGCCAGPRACLGRYRSGVKQFGRDIGEMVEGADVKGWLRKSCSLQAVKGKLPIVTWLPKYRCVEIKLN